MKTLVVQLLPHRQSIGRDVVISLLAIFSAGLLIFEIGAELQAHQSLLIYTLDYIIAMVFLVDFGYEVTTAKEKKHYIKKNWYLLLASVPISGGIFQAIRSVQLIRLMRIVRLYARIKAISDKTERVSKHSSRYIFVALFATVTIFSGASAFYLTESVANDQISSFYDSLWWAVVTATSVGYGDIYPVTPEGRLVAMVLMFFGLALIGTIVAVVSNYFLAESITRDSDKTA